MAITIPRDAPQWARAMADDISRELRARTRGFPVTLASFPKADLPDASRWVGSWIYVPDATGGAVPAFSNGTNWLRADTSAVIS